MLKLSDVKVYTDDKDEYRLIPHLKLKITKEVKHSDITKWAVLYSFSNRKMASLFLNTAKLFADPSIISLATKNMRSGTVFVLVVNRHAEGGMQDYEDWRDPDV